MRLVRKLKELQWMLGLLPTFAALVVPPAMAMDTDIFTSNLDSLAPNVLIVLDNTASYDNNKQHFPGGAQGEAEFDAISTVVGSLSGKINVGLMEFAKMSGSGTPGGGYVRYAIRPMGSGQTTDTGLGTGPNNQTAFKAAMATAKTNFRSQNAPIEKIPSSGQQYDNLMREAYNYFAGNAPYTPSSDALAMPWYDTKGYTSSAFSKFSPPLSSDNICAPNFIIFIGNPEPQGPVPEKSGDTGNADALKAAGGSTTQLKLPEYVQTTANVGTPLSYTDLCYASSSPPVFDQSNCSSIYDECEYYKPDLSTDTLTTPMNACSTGKRYDVVATSTSQTTSTSSVTNSSYANSTTCYATLSAAQSGVAAGDHAGMTCDQDTVTVSGNVTTTVSHSCSYAVDSFSSSCTGTNLTSTDTTTNCYATSSTGTDYGTLTCPSGYSCTYATGSTTGSNCNTATTQVTTGTTTSCYSSNAVGSDHGSLSCPSGYTCSYTTGSTSGSNCNSTQTSTATTSSCYTSNTVTGTDYGSLTCPSGYTCSYAVSSSPASTCSYPGTSTATTTAYYTSTPSITTSGGTVTSPALASTLSCPTGYSCTYAAAKASTASVGDTSSAYTFSCYTSTPSLTTPSTSGPGVTLQGTGLSCPANATCTYTATSNPTSAVKDGNNKNCGATGSTGNGNVYTITQTVSSVKYNVTQTPDASTHNKYTITQTAVPNTSAYHYNITQTATPIPSYHYTITQTASPVGPGKYKIRKTDVVTTTVVTTNTTTSTLGNTNSCYASQSACSTADYTCPTGATCTCVDNPSRTTDACPSGAYAAKQNMAIYRAFGWNQTIVTAPTGKNITDTNVFNADEWANFMNKIGVPVSGSSIKAPVATYTIDVYHDKPDAIQSEILASMAKWGGGRYFSATNEDAIISALKNIFSEIQAKNSTFASAALPIAANARGQNDNQVYIGMFRPDPKSAPRWYGNVKRYQLGLVNGATDLVDYNGKAAVSTTTGFIDPCRQSWWTSDSGNYWANVDGSGNASAHVFMTIASTLGTAWTSQGDDTDLAKGGCSDTSYSAYSDLPDGAVVEKGGVAQMIRKAATRNMKTSGLNSNTVVDFNTTNVTSLAADTTVNRNIVNFIRGQDVTGEFDLSPSTAFRPSVHGDVVHSRPLPVDYGTKNGSTVGVRVYYGSNDGTFRAVNADTGSELWAFVAPEFQSNSRLQRLLDNTPAIATPYPTPPSMVSNPPTGSAKDFFFDGSSGLYQNKDNSKVWIFPTMRRGGRMLYAFDVSDPNATAPTIKWKLGCPSSSVSDNTNCSTNNLTGSPLTGIGQTWSTPNLFFQSTYSTTKPVIVMGAGYDTCEDADSVTTDSSFCSGAKGAGVYVIDSDTGAIIRTFDTLRSVASEVALVDVNGDGVVDLAYAADTGGNIYRIKFSDTSTFQPLASSDWSITRVAYTSGGSRKFLFAPALLPLQGKVYVAIGSGDREHPTILSYPYTTPVTNRFYVYVDDPTSSTLTNLDSMVNYTVSSTDTCDTTPILPTSTAKGWFMDLTEHGPGEQTVTSAIIQGGMVAFSTNRPVASGNSCTNGLGEARGYWVNLLNGSGAISTTDNKTCGGDRSSIFVGGGLPPSPVTGVVTVNGVPQNIVIGAAQRDGSTSTPVGAQKNNPPINTKRSRVYWNVQTDTR